MGGGRGGGAATGAVRGGPSVPGMYGAPGGTARGMPERGIDRSAVGSAYAARPGGLRHEGQKHDGRKLGQKQFKHRGPFHAFAFGASDCWRMRFIGGAWRRVWACAYPGH
jgi:hypothetical protein